MEHTMYSESENIIGNNFNWLDDGKYQNTPCDFNSSSAIVQYVFDKLLNTSCIVNEQSTLNMRRCMRNEQGMVAQWSHLNTNYMNSYNNNLNNFIKFEYNGKSSNQPCGMGPRSMRYDARLLYKL